MHVQASTWIVAVKHVPIRILNQNHSKICILGHADNCQKLAEHAASGGGRTHTAQGVTHDRDMYMHIQHCHTHRSQVPLPLHIVIIIIIMIIITVDDVE